MIATVGGQPQVVTFALDELRAQGEEISRVILLYLESDDTDVWSSLTKLRDEFANGFYRGQPCQLETLAFHSETGPLDGIRNEADADATWQTVRGLLTQLKADGTKLHVCVSGGRRMVALLVMSAAALLCDHHDRLWHMYMPNEFQERARGGAILHAQPEDSVQLVQVPLVPWGAYFPALRAMALAPQEAVAAQMGWLRNSEEQCQQVYACLTERQQEVLVAFAQGSSPQDVAESLSISMATVNTHKTVILDECRNAWQLDPEERLDYHFLRERFEPFVQRMRRLGA